MAHSLSITDGTTTVSLSSSNIFLMGYVPTAPDMQESSIFANGGDGGEVLPIYGNVQDTVEIMFENSSKTALQAQVNTINRLLNLAKHRQTKRTGDKVYLKLTVDGDSDTYRSEVLGGKLELGEDSLRHYANIKVQARLYISRRYYWEGDDETELQLSKSSVSATTGGVTIYNHDDGGSGHDNWVQIAAAQVDGELPCPLRLTLTNNSGSSQGYRTFHIGTNAFSDPSNFTHIIEGEDAESGGTVTSDSSCSGGSKLVNNSWTGTNLVQFSISGSQLSKTEGRWFRLLMRLASLTSTCYIRPEIRDGNGLITLYAGEEVLISSDVPIIDLGSVPLPPSAANVSWSQMRLTLVMRAVGTASIQIDYVELMPTDSYATFTQLGYAITNGSIVTIDGIEGAIHSAGFPIYSAPLPTVWVWPNKLQRLIFTHDENTGPVSIDNTISVRAYYRPRRLTI